MLFNFGKKADKYKPGELLFDYFDGQTGLPMEPGYDEITLTATEDPCKLRLDVYSRPTGDGEEESKTSYIVSSQSLDDAMKLVKKYKIVKWNKKNSCAMCGRKTVCKFFWKGEFVRVSSDNMPDNGMGVFAEISSVLYGYVDPKLILKESDKEFVATLKVLHTVQNTMAMPREKDSAESEKTPEPEIITVREGDVFHGFTVTEVKDDYVRFGTDLFRYIVNNGPVENEFTVHKGEKIRLDMADILDATDTTVAELLDVTN